MVNVGKLDKLCEILSIMPKILLAIERANEEANIKQTINSDSLYSAAFVDGRLVVEVPAYKGISEEQDELAEKQVREAQDYLSQRCDDVVVYARDFRSNTKYHLDDKRNFFRLTIAGNLPDLAENIRTRTNILNLTDLAREFEYEFSSVHIGQLRNVTPTIKKEPKTVPEQPLPYVKQIGDDIRGSGGTWGQQLKD